MKNHSTLDRLFPLWQERNIRMFYILSVVYNMWFIAGVWVFIWGRFMTKTQIGISDAITFAIGFLVELPSGVVADLVGRRKAILFGNILLTLGNFLIAISGSFFSITLWYLVWTIGYAFQSGATEALAYDSVKKIGKENQWAKIIAASTIIGRISSLTATAVGGLLFGIWFRLPYLALAGVGVVGILAAYFLREIPVTHKPDLWSFKTYFRQIKDGLSTLAKPVVLPISLLSLAIAGIAYLYNWGLLRPLTGERFGYSPVTFPFLLSTISIVAILANITLVRQKLNVEKTIFLSALAFCTLFLVMGLPHGWIIGGLIMIALAIASMFVDQLFSRFINVHTKEEHRATTLSAVALFTRAPYVILALLIGSLAENNLLPQFTVVVGTVGIVICLAAFLLYKKTVAKL